MTEFWIQENDKYMLNDLCNIINDNVKTFTRSEPVQQPVFFQKKKAVVLPYILLACRLQYRRVCL